MMQQRANVVDSTDTAAVKRSHNLAVLEVLNAFVDPKIRERFVAGALSSASGESSSDISNSQSSAALARRGSAAAVADRIARAATLGSQTHSKRKKRSLRLLIKANMSKLQGQTHKPKCMASVAIEIIAKQRLRDAAMASAKANAHSAPPSRGAEVVATILEMCRGGAHRSPAPVLERQQQHDSAHTAHQMRHVEEELSAQHAARVCDELQRLIVVAAAYLDAPKQDLATLDDLNLRDRDGVVRPRTASAPQALRLVDVVNPTECGSDAVREEMAHAKQRLCDDNEACDEELNGLEECGRELAACVLMAAELIADPHVSGVLVEMAAAKEAKKLAQLPLFHFSHRWRRHRGAAMHTLGLNAETEARTRRPMTVLTAMLAIVQAFEGEKVGERGRRPVTAMGADAQQKKVDVFASKQRRREEMRRLLAPMLVEKPGLSLPPVNDASPSPSPRSSPGRAKKTKSRSRSSPRVEAMYAAAVAKQQRRAGIISGSESPTTVAQRNQRKIAVSRPRRQRSTGKRLLSSSRVNRMYDAGVTKMRSLPGRPLRPVKMITDDRGLIRSKFDGTITGKMGHAGESERMKILSLHSKGAAGVGFRGLDEQSQARVSALQRDASASWTIAEVEPPRMLLMRSGGM